jgi:nucleoside phosphorylase
MRPVENQQPVLGVLAPTRSEFSAFVGEADAGLSVPEVGDARRYRFGDAEAIGIVVGQGASRSYSTLERALDAGLIGRLLIVGVAGGTQPGQSPGDLLVGNAAGPMFAHPTPANLAMVKALTDSLREAGTPARVGPLAAVERLARSEEKLRLGGSGFIGVDMESQALLGCARLADLPAVVLRVVLDPVSRDIPSSVAALAAAQGGRLWPDILGLARWPLEVRAIGHFMRDLGTSLDTLRTVAVAAVSAGTKAGL